MKHSLAHLQDLIPTLAGVVAYMFIPAKVGIKSCRCARECFIYTCVWLHVHALELTITGWWIIVAYLSIPNWFELQLVSQLASYLFSYFLLRSLLPFSNSKFFLMSCLFTFYRILWL